MKKIMCVLLCVMTMITTLGFAEAIDYSSMSLDELLKNMQAIQTEIDVRFSPEDEMICMANVADKFTLYVSSTAVLENNQLSFSFIATNNTSENQNCLAYYDIDRWESGWANLFYPLRGGLKKKGDFTIDVSNADNPNESIMVHFRFVPELDGFRKQNAIGECTLLYKNGKLQLVK